MSQTRRVGPLPRVNNVHSDAPDGKRFHPMRRVLPPDFFYIVVSCTRPRPLASPVAPWHFGLVGSFLVDRHRPRIDLQVDATDLQLARRDGRLHRLAEAAVEQLADRPPLAGLGSLDQLGDDGTQIVRGDGLNECPAPGVHPGSVRVSTTGSGVVPRKESAMAVALGLAVPAICERFVHATC